MIITYSQMHCTDKYSQHSSVIWPVWLSGWVFVYKLSGCGFESRCCRRKTAARILLIFSNFWSFFSISYLSNFRINQVNKLKLGTHIDIIAELRPLNFFVWTKTTKRCDFWENVINFQVHLHHEDDVTEKWKVGTVKLIFHDVFKNVVVFDAASWDKAALNNQFSKYQKWTFWKKLSSLPPRTREKNVLQFS